MKDRFQRAALLALAAILLAFPASAQVDCNALQHWSNTIPRLNQTHVFCGEYTTAPKGFHSRPGGLNPNTVGAFVVTQPANAKGIYGGSWSYVGHSGQTKFSTMFPNACSMLEVINSILYAATHLEAGCPLGAPAWASCGMNRPLAADPNVSYCEAADGSRFFIAMGFVGNDVNTAFPLM